MIAYDEIKPKLTTELEKAKEQTQVAVREEPAVAVTEVAPVALNRAKPQMNTAMALDLVKRVLAYWARWPSEHALNIATLWVASTWFADSDGRLLFRAHPRLFFIAPKGSGKTRMMRVMQAMVRNPTGILTPIYTAPFIREAFSSGHTVFADELDRQIRTGRGHTDLQSLISAYQDSAANGNARGGYNQQEVFGPMVLGAKPNLRSDTNGLIEDLLERGFIIIPEKHQDRNDRIPRLDGDFEHAVELIPLILEAWGAAARPEKGHLWPIHDIPDEFDDERMVEISSALWAVADRAVDPRVIAAEGKDTRWAEMARDASLNMLLGHGSNGAEIFADIEARFRELGIEL